MAMGHLVNAFNALNRKKMLHFQNTGWPEATSLYDKMYGFDAPVLYLYEEGDGKVVRVMRSAQGSRMGDILGTRSFNMAAHHTYETVSSEFPDYEIMALTDDCFDVPPPPPTDPSLVPDYFDRMTKCLLRQREINAESSLLAHPDKGVLYLPPGCPSPPDGHAILSLLKVTRHGLVVGGSPIGTDEFVASHAHKKVTSLFPRIDATIKLGSVNKQAAFKVLGESVNHALDYYLRTTPPQLITDSIDRFDAKTNEAALDILSLPNTSSTPTPRQILSFSVLRSLPCSSGGAAHTLSSIKAPCAFLAAALSARSHPLLSCDPNYLSNVTSYSYTRLSELLETQDFSGYPDVASVIPLSPDDFSRTAPLLYPSYMG